MGMKHSIKKFTDWIVGINQPEEDSIDEDKLHYELETLYLPENGKGVLLIRSNYPTTLEMIHNSLPEHDEVLKYNALFLDKETDIQSLSDEDLRELGLQRINKEEVADEE